MAASLVRALAAAAMALAAAGAEATAPIKPWTKGATPPLVLSDLSGKTVDLKSLRGRVVVVNFWASWCEPCREEMPSLERLRARLAGKPFELLTVNYDESHARVERFIDQLGLSLPVLLDPEKRAASAWKVGGLPMTFVIDADGHVRYWTFGERDWSEGESLEKVEGLIPPGRSARR